MAHYGIGDREYRFAQLLWRQGTILIKDLIKLAEQEMNWHKSTTYTVLRRLCGLGMFQNEDGLITTLITEEEYKSNLSEKIVMNAFQGSFCAFATAFLKKRPLTQKEKDELMEMIKRMDDEPEQVQEQKGTQKKRGKK